MHRTLRSWRRPLVYLGMFGVTTVTAMNVLVRYKDTIEATDHFGIHSQQQQRKYRFSGMHEPFVTTNINELNIFREYFSKYAFLLPDDVDTMKQRHSLKTTVTIKPLSACPNQPDMNLEKGNVVVVGGPPALISGVAMIKHTDNLVYINDQRRVPIADGSAWHLEQDAETEAPTGYHPAQFLFEQLIRATVGYVSHASIEKTGYFPWRTLDWIGWLQHPNHWFAGLRIMIAYQWFTIFGDRKETLKKVAIQCRQNEKFFDNLNDEFNGQLLLAGHGSIIVARSTQQVADLQTLKTGLTAEGRELKMISNDEMINRYGFLPNGLLYGEKVHDRVLAPNFMRMLRGFIRERRGIIIDGTLLTIYKNNDKAGGFVEYRTRDDQTHVIPFSQLIMSLGNQLIMNKNNQPLFDVVAARGVSVLAHVYVPDGYRLPPVLVCGDTNHATKLTENPIRIQKTDGKFYNLYLMRLTGGACITPNVSDKSTANYDGTLALGVISAVRRTFGDQCKVEPLVAYGCNRQVSRYGQISWMEPYPGIHVQYGAGGGGLTRAPDFVAKS